MIRLKDATGELKEIIPEILRELANQVENNKLMCRSFTIERGDFSGEFNFRWHVRMGVGDKMSSPITAQTEEKSAP